MYLKITKSKNRQFIYKRYYKNCSNIEFGLQNPISKNSLFINDNKTAILSCVKNTLNDKIIIIHGTDSIKLTSKFLSKLY